MSETINPELLACPGDILFTGRDNPEGYLRADGAFVDQAAYPDLFAVVGLMGGTDADGSSWDPSSLPISAKSVAQGNGIAVAVGLDGQIATSPDGATWTQQTGPNTSDDLDSVTFGDGLFVASGPLGVVWTSPDGTTWTRRTFTAFGNGDYNCHGSLGFVTMDRNRRFHASPDGEGWDYKSTIPGSGVSNALTQGGGLVVAVGWTGLVWTSPDAITWTRRTGIPSSAHLFGVAHGNGLFVTIGLGGVIWTSPNAIAWTQQTSPVTADLTGIVFDGERFVAVGSNGTLLTSLDGVAWTKQTGASTSDGLLSVSAGELGLVAVSANVSWISDGSYPYDESTEFQLPTVPDQGDVQAWVKT